MVFQIGWAQLGGSHSGCVCAVVIGMVAPLESAEGSDELSYSHGAGWRLRIQLKSTCTLCLWMVWASPSMSSRLPGGTFQMSAPKVLRGSYKASHNPGSEAPECPVYSTDQANHSGHSLFKASEMRLCFLYEKQHVCMGRKELIEHILGELLLYLLMTEITKGSFFPMYRTFPIFLSPRLAISLSLISHSSSNLL